MTRGNKTQRRQQAEKHNTTMTPVWKTQRSTPWVRALLHAKVHKQTHIRWAPLLPSVQYSWLSCHNKTASWPLSWPSKPAFMCTITRRHTGFSLRNFRIASMLGFSNKIRSGLATQVIKWRSFLSIAITSSVAPVGHAFACRANMKGWWLESTHSHLFMLYLISWVC